MPASRRIPPILALLVLVAACANGRLPLSVTHFHDPAFESLEPLANRTADVIPARPALADDPRFTDFGDRLGQRLARLGLRPAGGGPAAIHARLDYVSTPRQEQRRGPRIGIGIGVGHVGRHVGVGGHVGVPVETGRQVKLWDHRVSVALVRAQDGHVFWEGRVLLNGTGEPLDAVFDAMLDALFADFPGANGVTRTVLWPPEG
ncbi:MAG: hypothetical protein D6740_10930 [Alphaproteobacteria bacterium]|nr:MAG: hypothetical protein D6740_10930 [Alphaproteobacteria bacterium]